MSIEKTLDDLRIPARIVETWEGPSLTLYGLEPEPGIRNSRYRLVTDDLARVLGVPMVRVLTPIPDTTLIGIEVPKKDPDLVRFQTIWDTVDQSDPTKLMFPVGVAPDGDVITADLAAMPHLLIAGTTGSGKSVMLNVILCALSAGYLDRVSLSLIDLKRVEFAPYANLPDLFQPIATEADDAVDVLIRAAYEMEKRYRILERRGTRALTTDRLVIVIDELADLMGQAKKLVEPLLRSLAQKGRAAGIHLVVATQRPSVDVVTGVLKANLPSRIAFALPSITDSRTVLDYAGAEKLLGKGDMLFRPPWLIRPVRLQGAFVSDREVDERMAPFHPRPYQISGPVVPTVEEEPDRWPIGKLATLNLLLILIGLAVLVIFGGP